MKTLQLEVDGKHPVWSYEKDLSIEISMTQLTEITQRPNVGSTGRKW